MNATDAQIKEALQKYKRITVIGMSDDSSRASFGVSKFLISAGYEVYGVNPKLKEILGRPCFESLSKSPQPLEIVDVFRKSDAVPEIVDEVIALGAKMLWLQEGVVSPEAEAKAIKAGILVVSDRCIYKEHRRLLK